MYLIWNERPYTNHMILTTLLESKSDTKKTSTYQDAIDLRNSTGLTRLSHVTLKRKHPSSNTFNKTPHCPPSYSSFTKKEASSSASIPADLRRLQHRYTMVYWLESRMVAHLSPVGCWLLTQAWPAAVINQFYLLHQSCHICTLFIMRDCNYAQ